MSQILTVIETTEPLLKRNLWFAAKVSTKLVLKLKDKNLKTNISSLKENATYKVEKIEHEDIDAEGGIVDRIYVQESFIGKFVRCENDSVLFFDDVVDFLNNNKTISVKVDRQAKIEIVEVDINKTNGESAIGDDIYDVDEVSSSDFEPIADENLDYENKVEIIPCNMKGHEVLGKLNNLLNKNCAVIWGEKDLGDFYLKSFSEAEACIKFTFLGGELVFTVFRDKIRVVASNKNHTKSETRDRTDTLHIIPKLNQ